MFWKSEFFIKSAEKIADSIEAFQYEINGVWTNANVTSEGQESSDAYHIYRYFLIEIPSDISGTITGFRALGANNAVIGSRTENIIKSSGSALVYKFKIRVYEEENK